MLRLFTSGHLVMKPTPVASGVTAGSAPVVVTNRQTDRQTDTHQSQRRHLRRRRRRP